MSADRGAAKVLYLSEQEVRPLITPGEALEHAETAFRLYAQSLRGQVPASFSPMMAYHTTVPNSDVDYRSGSMVPVPTLCSTLGFGYADNPSRFGLSSMHSFAVLTDVETGVPKCIMAQGSFFISFLRTGAAAAIASKYLAAQDVRSIAMVGAGNLARHTLRCHLAQYGSPEEIRVWSRTKAASQQFAADMGSELGVTLKPVASPDEAVQGASIVYCTTRSQDAVVQNEWVSPGTHLNAFGSDAPGKRELDPAILGRAKVVVDSLEQCKIGGEVSTPIAQGKMSEDDVYAELGEIVNGWKKGRETEDEVTVMDSTGLAALDVVAFNHAYEKALAQGVGTELEL